MTNLFSPITMNGLTLPNRIVIPPMDQYSAENGVATEWHSIHYGHLALSGAGLLIVEATAVEAIGRISPNDLGIWNDEQEEGHRAMLRFIRKFSRIPMGIQLGHAGRKASCARPWDGKGALSPAEGGWEVCAPSAAKYDPSSPEPVALTAGDMPRLVKAFVDVASRADRAGYDVIELHAAHGYLLHQFLSPLANFRTDEYGGTLEGRMRFPLEVFKAVRAVVPLSMPVGVRVSGSDFTEGGWNVEECAVFAKELEKLGCSFIHVSGGGLSPNQKITLGPGYQVSMAARVKAATAMPTIAVGLITEPELASGIIISGQADMVAIGRGMLYDPRWPWHAAAKLGVSITDAPRQYLRSEPRTAKGLFI
ncbi:MAG: NADH:flavin oxidoreductase/NADH oxidase [Deltaproteobacteria bacterium]|nr:NADH:flavin oxidoreductase/NADH oxidase [Deltaproteobacteria bacterium]